MIEGGLVGLKLKSFLAEVILNSTGEGGCLAKLKIEYESLEDSLLSEKDVTSIKERKLAMMKAIEGYLLANPDAYAWDLVTNNKKWAQIGSDDYVFYV